MPDQTFIETDRKNWLKLDQFPGAQLFPLSELVADGSIHKLRMKAGTVIPAHAHPCNEYVYVISGELDTGGRKCAQGTYWSTPAYTRQGPHTAITDVEIITVRLGPMGKFDGTPS